MKKRLLTRVCVPRNDCRISNDANRYLVFLLSNFKKCRRKRYQFRTYGNDRRNEVALHCNGPCAVRTAAVQRLASLNTQNVDVLRFAAFQ